MKSVPEENGGGTCAFAALARRITARADDPLGRRAKTFASARIKSERSRHSHGEKEGDASVSEMNGGAKKGALRAPSSLTA
jgi:hypothetical protein